MPLFQINIVGIAAFLCLLVCNSNYLFSSFSSCVCSITLVAPIVNSVPSSMTLCSLSPSMTLSTNVPV